MKLGYIEDREFGRVLISTRRGMTRVNARWVNGVLEMHFPAMPLTEAAIRRKLDEMRHGIASIRERADKRKVEYHEGQVIQGFCHTITLGRHTFRQDSARYGTDPADESHLFVELPQGADFASRSATLTISACLKELCRTHAERFLIPFAHDIATDRGVKPRGFVIGRGMRKLGHCTREGIIQLSYNLMLYPRELVEYVVCHEFAHLKEFNHSPRFHAECNRLCHGEERVLEAALKRFVLPVLK